MVILKFKNQNILSQKIFNFSLFLIALFISTASMAVDVSVRLANPVVDCINGTYCLDVEFQANEPNQELFGMNVRFLYDDNVLEFIDFRDFQGGYSAVAPNPPTVMNSGFNFLNFPGNSTDFVNGAIQLTNFGATPIQLPSNGSWEKIFQICFSIEDANINVAEFCPSVVWDLEQNRNNGSIISNASDGVVMTIVNQGSRMSASLPADEVVEQFNWAYSSAGPNGSFGMPVQTVCVPAQCQPEPPGPDPEDPVEVPAFSLGKLLLFGLMLVGFSCFVLMRRTL